MLAPQAVLLFGASLVLEVRARAVAAQLVCKRGAIGLMGRFIVLEHINRYLN